MMIFKKVLLKDLLISSFIPMLMVLSPPGILAQNVKVDGYKGIWFSFGQSSEYGFKYSGGSGTYTSNHRPVAIYSPEVKKTFFVYGGTTSADEKHLLIMISYFNHKRNVVPKPVIVYDKMGVSDPHDNASLSIDNNGYLWIFIAGRTRTRPGLIFKSRESYSIESFDQIETREMTFPQPWFVNGEGFLLMYTKFTRGREIYCSTSIDGITWEDEKKLCGMGGNSQVSGVYGNMLISVFNYHPLGNFDKRTNLYLIQTEDMGKTWKTIDKLIIETPLTDPFNEALIKNYEAEGRLVFIEDLNFDKDGNPVILIILSKHFLPGPQGNPREWIVIHRKDNNWIFSKVCESTNNYDKGSIYITEDGWIIIGPTEKGPREYGPGGEIALWTSRDEGFTWEKSLDITSDSRYNNSYVRRPLNVNNEFYAFWVDGDASDFSASKLYFTNSKGNRVWVLPYDMKRDFEKPVRVK
jgi:hypothetical protein